MVALLPWAETKYVRDGKQFYQEINAHKKWAKSIVIVADKLLVHTYHSNSDICALQSPG